MRRRRPQSAVRSLLQGAFPCDRARLPLLGKLPRSRRVLLELQVPIPTPVVSTAQAGRIRTERYLARGEPPVTRHGVQAELRSAKHRPVGKSIVRCQADVDAPLRARSRVLGNTGVRPGPGSGARLYTPSKFHAAVQPLYQSDSSWVCRKPESANPKEAATLPTNLRIGPAPKAKTRSMHPSPGGKSRRPETPGVLGKVPATGKC